MFRTLAFVVTALLAIGLTCSSATAEQRGRRAVRIRGPHPDAAARTLPARPLDAREGYSTRAPNPYSYWREIYPQFYGGFHYRQIYEFGPPGDFGFRGAPW